MPCKRKGWKGESKRHAMAARKGKKRKWVRVKGEKGKWKWGYHDPYFPSADSTRHRDPYFRQYR